MKHLLLASTFGQLFSLAAALSVTRRSSNQNATEKSEADQHLSGKNLQDFCYLKSKLMHMYELDPMPSKFRSGTARCAVVSSSGALRYHQHGPDIDKHDVVLRFNTAPTVGWEKIVGSFTTYRMGWNFPPNNSDPVIKVNASWVERWSSHHSNILRRLYPYTPVQGKTDDPTTGFYGMFMALANCGEIDAYEMAPSGAAVYAGYSYYSTNWQNRPGNATINGWHGMVQAEHDLWHRMALNPLEAKQTGKSKHPCFKCVSCPSSPSSFASISPERRSLLDAVVELVSPPPSDNIGKSHFVVINATKELLTVAGAVDLQRRAGIASRL